MRGRPLGQSELTSQGKDRDERNIGNANLQSLNSALPKFYKLAQTSDNLTADQQNAINRMCDIKISLYQKYYKMANQMGATMVAEYLKFSIPYIEKSKKSLNLIGNLFNVIDNDFENYVKNAKFSSNKNNRFVYSQSQVQNSPSATPIDQAARSYTEKLDNGLFTFLDLNKNFELSQGNLQAFREGGIVFKTLISNWERQKVLNETGKGLPAPTQLKPSLRRAVVAENEMYVDTLAGLTRDESFVRTNLAKKRGSYKETYQQKKESLDRAQRMDVDLGEGQDGQTPNETPAKIKSMYEDLAKWLSDVVKNIRYEKDLLKRSFDRMINERDPNKALDPSAKMQIEKSLTEIQNDLKYFENEYGKYASTALIATEMARKQRFLQKIGPIQKKIAAMIKGGFSPVGLMFNYSQADAGGDSQSYGQLLYSILNEEKKALGILRNAYIEARQSTTPVDLSTYLGITGTNSTGEVEIR
jgi:Tfp pilus assembly major pilin PilA